MRGEGRLPTDLPIEQRPAAHAPVELSRVARRLTWASAVLFGVLGAVFFVAPGWAAQNFPWNVSPFVAMTIGGWSLGTAGMAFVAAWVWRLAWVYPILAYLWLFGLAELAVVVAFRERLLVGNVLTWPYLAALGVTVTGAVVGVLDWVRRRVPARDDREAAAAADRQEDRVPLWYRLILVGYTVLTTILWIGNAQGDAGSPVTQGLVFPEQRSLFTVRAFAAFFFALGAGGVAVLLTRSLRAYLTLTLAGMTVIVPITVASLLNLGAFDFRGRPGGALYLGAYVLAFFVAGGILVYYRRRLPPYTG